MKAVVEEIDSRAFGRPVLKILEPEKGNFTAFEMEYRAAHSPFYVYVKIAAENLALVHFFELHGFSFIEAQLRMTRRLNRLEIMEDPFGLFEYTALEEVGPDDDIEAILHLSEKLFTHDRITIDPHLGPEPARRRYRAYLEKSRQNADEFLFRYLDRRSGRLMGFHSSLKLDGRHVMHLLGGLAPDFQGGPASPGLGQWLRRTFYEMGFRRVTTNISLANYAIMEAEYKGCGFKAEQTSIVLRKIYPSP